MIISDRLRKLRQEKQLSQGDIEKRTGLLPCYLSRVENGHTVPAIQTLEKLARALEVPMYQLFYDGNEPPRVPTSLRTRTTNHMEDWASRGEGSRAFAQLRRALSHMAEGDRRLLLQIARKMSQRNRCD